MPPPYTRKTGDVLPVFDRTLNVDVTGKTVDMVINLVGGTETVRKVITSVTVLTPSTGVVEATAPVGFLDVAGAYDLDWQVRSGTGALEQSVPDSGSDLLTVEDAL